MDTRECSLISEGFLWRESRCICGSSGQAQDLGGSYGQLSNQTKETFQTELPTCGLGCGFPVAGSVWHGQCGHVGGRLGKFSSIGCGFGRDDH